MLCYIVVVFLSQMPLFIFGVLDLWCCFTQWYVFSCVMWSGLTLDSGAYLVPYHVSSFLIRFVIRAALPRSGRLSSRAARRSTRPPRPPGSPVPGAPASRCWMQRVWAFVQRCTVMRMALFTDFLWHHEAVVTGNPWRPLAIPWRACLLMRPSPAADSFALGMLMFYVASGRKPLKEVTRRKTHSFA